MAPAVSVVEYEIVPLTLYAFVVSKFVRFPAKNVRVTGIDWFVPTGATEFAVQLTSVVNAQMLFLFGVKYVASAPPAVIPPSPVPLKDGTQICVTELPSSESKFAKLFLLLIVT